MLNDLQHSLTRRKTTRVDVFDINFATFRRDQIKAIFEKFNFENLIDDIISNDDFNVFKVQNITSSNFDEMMENSFGKTLPEDIKNQFVRQYIKHWSDLGCENSLKFIPDNIQHGKTLNWRVFQHPTIILSDSGTSTCRSWRSLIRRQTRDDNSYFFIGNFGKPTMKSRYPELVEQFKKSAYPKGVEISALSSTTGLTDMQIRGWFYAERKRNHVRMSYVLPPELMESFEHNPSLTKTEKQRLSECTGMSHSAISQWFVRERKQRKILRPSLSNKYPELEKQFRIDSYSTKQHKNLALITGLSERQVKSWFRRKRISTISNLATKYPELEVQFESNPYITPKEIDTLAFSTGLTQKEIENWFKFKKNWLSQQNKKGLATKYPQLLEQFQRNPHPSQSDLRHLIEVTGLSRDQIFNWFRNQQKLNGLSGPVFSDHGKVTMKETYPELEKQFNINPYPSKEEKAKLSEKTGLTYQQVHSWFHAERLRFGLSCTNTVHYKGQSLSVKYPELEQQFQANPSPTQAETLELMKTTGLTEFQIRKHFYNRRRRGL